MRLPAIFISHGMPSMAVDPGPTGRFLSRLPQGIEHPRAIVCISAHLEGTQALVTVSARPETIHDFSGFSKALHAMRYPAPGDPTLAVQIVAMLQKAGIEAQGLDDRGLDHGAWVPLSLMYPQADVPVVQLSVQTDATPEYHLALGRALAPLRDDKVLVEFALRVPVGLARKLWYDGVDLIWEGVSLYFLVSSICYGGRVNAN